jgi:cystathionine beta-lyase
MVKIADLEGTYLVWADLRFLNLTCQEISDGLLEQGMIIKAGETYGEGCNGFIRLNIACGMEQLKTGMDMLKRFVLSKINK